MATRDMLVQFDQESVAGLSSAFPEFEDMKAMFELAGSGIEFHGFDAKLAQRRMAEIRDNTGAARILAFLQLLVEINQHAEKRQLSVVAVTQPEDSNKHTRIAQVVDHITRHFADDISLETAAELACMSPTAFSRNFQKITGNDSSGIPQSVRVGQACSMLYATDQPVSGICYEVGFQNLANFNRHFMKMKNMTPTAYRALARVDLVKKGRQLHDECANTAGLCHRI